MKRLAVALVVLVLFCTTAAAGTMLEAGGGFTYCVNELTPLTGNYWECRGTVVNETPEDYGTAYFNVHVYNANGQERKVFMITLEEIDAGTAVPFRTTFQEPVNALYCEMEFLLAK
ncbi:MAG: FxLYD domain-containing protein [Synergistales bacterium]|nr:FxLYD domain-containing protein [Synergistales bacterium]